MREAVRRRKQPGRTTLEPLPWVAPVKGWKTAQPLQAMDPQTAALLQNFFPEPGYVRARNGSASWATGCGAQVNTLMPYSGSSKKFFAAAGSNIYDVTSSGAVGAAAVSSLTSDHWSFAQMSTGGGFYLTIANGADTVRQYNGSAWSTPAFTGVTTSTLSVVWAHRERLYFIQKGTTSLWYGGTSAITGALTQLDCGPDLHYGGVLVAMGTWTLVTVYGSVVILLVVISDQGELLFFQGSNPADSTNWSLLGNAKLSPPLGGDRCLTQVGGDLAIMTLDGVVPASKALTLDPAASDLVSLTRDIAPTFLDTVQSVGTSGAWQFLTFPARRMGIVNVPDPVNGTYQLVFNTETHAWCSFTGLPATCWGVWNNKVFFGTSSGTVVQAETGANDQGNAITCLMCGAWNASDGVTRKMPSFLAINAESNVGVTLYGCVSTDFTVKTPTNLAAITGGVGASVSNPLWGTATWDGWNWPGATSLSAIAAAGVAAPGVAIAPTVQAIVSGDGQPSDCFIFGGSILLELGQFI